MQIVLLSGFCAGSRSGFGFDLVSGTTRSFFKANDFTCIRELTQNEWLRLLGSESFRVEVPHPCPDFEGRESLEMATLGREGLDMPKFCRESMDMILGPQPGKTAQKPLKSYLKNRSKITARNERFLSGFLSKI